MAIEISAGQDRIDSRDVDKAIDDLEELCTITVTVTDSDGESEVHEFGPDNTDTLRWELETIGASAKDVPHFDLDDLFEDLDIQFTSNELDFAIEVSADADDFELLKELQKFKEDVDSSEWSYGMTLIHEDAFPDYIEKLCTEVGYISSNFPSWIEIDWFQTAENCEGDYCTAEFDGHTYFYHA